jgi:signal transduction histidine kinase
VVGGAILTGGLVGLVLIAFRGRIGESTAWWQAACARERALREFTELAAPHLGDEMLASAFAARFRGVFGRGHCTIALAGADGGAESARAVAGTGSSEAPSPAQIAGLLAAVADRQPRIADSLEAASDGALAGSQSASGAVVLLPIVIDERVDGVVVLVAPDRRRVAAEDLLLWRAMANQVGAAVGSARLFARLQDALRSRSEFVNTMSHELRSPLHVILGYADMLAEGREEIPFLAGRIRASALELLQLVENTLAVARLGTGRLRLELTDFELPGLVEELRESTRALPEAQHAVAVRWQVADDLPPARLDRLKVKEIVHNLVSNALKFTERGTVTVRVGCEGARLRIDVEDTGAGIPPSGRDRIFEMFERLEPANGSRAGGVGLGLYIVRNLVQLMQGTVTLASELGQGSRFTVWLPLRL